MNVIGISGLDKSIPFKRKEFPKLSNREYNIAQGFDAAAALVGPNGIIAAAAEERFTREKATGAFPIHAINFCLQAARLQPEDVDYVAHGFSYKPYRSTFETEPFSRRQYLEVYAPEVQKQLLKEHFGHAKWHEKFVPVPHHLAHAASAFYPSGFSDALILVSDGMGEVQSMTVAVGKGREINVLAEVPAFHSLGTLYGVFTLYLGFYMNSDEYKVMGLAPYGQPKRFLNQILEFISLKDDGTYTIPIFSHNHTLPERETHAGILKVLIDKFGPMREPESEITQTHKDLAAALQAALQTCQLHVLRHFKRKTGLKNLCMAGGVALNCSANGVIRRSEVFRNVFVQPAAGDDGCSLGAALYVQNLKSPEFKPAPMGVPLWGPEFTDDDVRRELGQRDDCHVVELDTFAAVCRETASRLSRGEIVAWFQGRMEFGPRALGSRSILADARDPGMRDKINSLVKKREGFRPFAPVVMREGATRIFEIKKGEEESYSHMLYVTHVRPEYREMLPATTHVDGSARVQTVAKDQNNRLWQLLNEFNALTEMPVLLNTSFNVRGQPIVCTPREAIDTFLAAKLDALVLGNFLVIPKKADAISDQDPVRDPSELEEASARHEEFWVNRLGSLEPVSLPWKRKEKTEATAFCAGELSSPISEELREKLVRANGQGGHAEIVFAAFVAFISRLTGSESFDILFGESRIQLAAGDKFASFLPFHCEPVMQNSFSAVREAVAEEIETVRGHVTYALDSVASHPALQKSGATREARLPIAVQITGDMRNHGAAPEVELTLLVSQDVSECRWIYDETVIEASDVAALAEQFKTFLKSLLTEPNQPLSDAPLLTEAERRKVLFEWNDTRIDGIPQKCVHDLFAAQAKKTPDATALVFENQHYTYRELDERADAVATQLRNMGVGPDVLVGVCMEVSLEMMVGLLGVLKAGGAYVPLDPGYPKDRIAFMLKDAMVTVLVTQQALITFLPETEARVLLIDKPSHGYSSHSSGESSGNHPSKNGNHPSESQSPTSLAYVIYTSGSTGQPKGVMVTHANVVNFFAGMDRCIGAEPPGVWLAVTSISFDISVLELFWTLTRGFKVVLQRREERTKPSAQLTHNGNEVPLPDQLLAPKNGNRSQGQIGFSLLYFASDESAGDADKYRLLLEGARFADTHGFTAIWTPERHFHAFGGLYPNPAVTSAAVAAITSNIQIRAGSVVAPLHHPARVAEEWAVVDNLSNGRAGISFASGWQINDFTLAPANHARRKEIMLDHLESVRKLWRGESVSFAGVNGANVSIKTLPRPVQAELPVWITASGNPETFKTAGEAGANLLTHLLGQSISELKEKIEVYRTAWKEAGHPGEGCVTLMVHTFVGPDLETVRNTVRKPFTQYLRSSIDLIKNDPWAFGTTKKPNGASAQGAGAGAVHYSPEELDVMADHAFDRYFETSGLFGDVERCLKIVSSLHSAGVNEVACLIDFGVEPEVVLNSLEALNEVRSRTLSRNPQKENTAQRSDSVSSTEAIPLAAINDYSVPAQIQRHNVTHFQCTPSLVTMLLEDPRAVAALGSLKKLFLGGEALPPSLLHTLDISSEIFNMYGPTETTIWSATKLLNKAEPSVSIGRPIANTQIYILDKNRQPVPSGFPGEILIGGSGVVRGYLHRPELTEEKFVQNPFEGDSTARLYHTGDLGRFLPDGTIEFLGRLDQQVKLRGFRIELGEIETALRRIAGVKDCVVIVREETPGDKRLVAYLVHEAQEALNSSMLRQTLSSTLPQYMIPSAFVPVAAIPLTPNGKIDRKALPAPKSVTEQKKQCEAPRSLTEEKVAQVMCEVLGINQIDLHDNFFEFGGNSLLATQLIARLRESFRWELPLRLAFEFPTVAELAQSVAAEGKVEVKHRLPKHHAIERDDTREELPLSFAQQRIWFLHQLEPGSHYNDHFDLRLKGPLDPGILQKAINEIIRRHQTLRSLFIGTDGGPALSILPEQPLYLQCTDLRSLPAAKREEKAIQLAADDCSKPFDLEHGPLMRASLVQLDEEDHLLIVTFDHIVVDGWSHGVFLSELVALYEAYLAGKESPLPELPIQYSDYAAWQQEWLNEDGIKQSLAYWREQLRGAPAMLEIPTDHSRPAVQTFEGARLFFTIDKEIVDKLSSLGRKQGGTLFMVMLSAFQSLLAKYSGREDILIGTPIANRNRAETEALIGSFMNTLVLRGDLSGDPAFSEVVRRARRISLDAYAHQDVPFEKLVAELQPARARSYSPIFQVMFILQNTPMPEAKVGNLSISHFDIDAGTSKMDLTLNLEETPEGAVGWLEYSTKLFRVSTITSMVEDFQKILKEVVEHPDARLSEIKRTLNRNQRHSLLDTAPRDSRAAGFEIPETANLLTSGTNGITEGRTSPSLPPHGNGTGSRKGAKSIEMEITEIWSEVLGVSSIGPNDNLFDLGGHSLLITRIISRIRKTFHVEVAIHAFFETPTVSAIAEIVKSEMAVSAEPENVSA